MPLRQAQGKLSRQPAGRRRYGRRWFAKSLEEHNRNVTAFRRALHRP
jgi:hypothetical protein